MIRHPIRIQRAFPVSVLLRLPVPRSTVERRFQHCSVSGFPLPCLRSCIPYAVACAVQEPLGPPKFFDASLPACHGLRTPADLRHLAHTVVRVLPSGALKPSASATSLFEAVPALQGARSPLRPTGYAVYASPILFAGRDRPDSAMDARLATGGWLALTRQGLSPCKRCQAFLGAITLALTCRHLFPYCLTTCGRQREIRLPQLSCPGFDWNPVVVERRNGPLARLSLHAPRAISAERHECLAAKPV